MTTAKYIQPPKLCTGCSLCANVCPRDVIQMIFNEEGFLEPQVNVSGCINCGLCVKSCPAQPSAISRKKSTVSFDSVSAYGGWHKEKLILGQSSSGGLFSALAERVFAENGCVFGVAWQNKTTAAFFKADNMQELEPMRGSKYTQAVPNYVYREVKVELEKGRSVLFVGTSCQVHALKKYLRRPHERLLTVDILCAGVPSRHLLSSYVDYLERVHGKELRHINFRYKDGNWLRYKVQCVFVDGDKYSEYSDKNLFMHLFLDGKFLNACCYECPYTRLPRQGDITLGDYWGVQNYEANWPISEGINSIVVSSDKGKKAIMELEQKRLIELHPQHFSCLHKGQPHNYNIRKKKKASNNRKKILETLHSQSLEDVHNAYYNYVRMCFFRVHRHSILSKMQKKLSTLFQKMFSCFWQ